MAERTKRKRALLELARRLGGATVEKEVRLLFDDAPAYRRRFRKRLEERFGDPVDELEDIDCVALLDALEARKIAWSIDWRTFPEEVMPIVDVVAGKRRGRWAWTKDVEDLSDVGTEDFLHRAGTRMAASERVVLLALMLDAGGDDFPVTCVPRAAAKKTLQLARAAGFHPEDLSRPLPASRIPKPKKPAREWNITAPGKRRFREKWRTWERVRGKRFEEFALHRWSRTIEVEETGAESRTVKLKDVATAKRTAAAWARERVAAGWAEVPWVHWELKVRGKDGSLPEDISPWRRFAKGARVWFLRTCSTSIETSTKKPDPEDLNGIEIIECHDRKERTALAKKLIAERVADGWRELR